MDIKNLVKQEIKGICPYRPGKPIAVLLKEKGLEQAFKLASNENPLGSSPLALKAIEKILPQLNRYPEGSGPALRGKLAKIYGVKPEEVILGNGSSEVLSLALLTFLNPGEEVILPEPTFTIYEILVLMCCGIPVKVPLNSDFGYNPDRMAGAVTEKTKFLFLNSPNNPTGTIIKKNELKKLLTELPERVIVVLDEAYAEYAESDDFTNGISLFSERPLIVTRTFSKLYGLAGLRIGYGIADASIIEEMNKIRPPFNTTIPSQVAAAAALDDSDFTNKSLENNRVGKKRLYKGLSELKVAYVPTEANFILIDLVKDAPKICSRLEDKGVIVRPMDNPKMKERYIRLTVGTPEENKLFLESLTEILTGGPCPPKP
jgi:histidinol-phosphate aminotransferase